MTIPRYGAAAALFAVCLGVLLPASTFGQAPALKIVVVDGEDAVNIIQQKTAVAPVVEVRDRNDQPVAGALVRFAIQGGRASFGGARTLAVTTDLAGRAVATGLTPTASGALQISASAAFQGQTAAAVTIAQTNVMTAAQAAAVSSAGGAGAGGGSGTASAGAAGGGASGGGLSATTIGVIGGAAAGGALVATKIATGGPQEYSGPFAFNWNTACLVERISGTIIVEIDTSSEDPGTTISNGHITLKNTTANDVSRPAGCGVQGQGNWGMPDSALTGTVGNLVAHGQDSVTSRVGTTIDRTYDFQGALQNGAVNGTFTMTWRDRSLAGPGSSGTSSVTLNRVQ